MNAIEFESRLRADGFREIETKGYAPGIVNEEHQHPFEVRALVLEGDITLTSEDGTRTYGPGEVFTMAAGCAHAEAIGPGGVRYLVGRRR